MTHDELLAKIDKGGTYAFEVDSYGWLALKAVVEYLKDWESWQETWAGDMPMTVQQEARRIEREKLVKEITAIIEKELK